MGRFRTLGGDKWGRDFAKGRTDVVVKILVTSEIQEILATLKVDIYRTRDHSEIPVEGMTFIHLSDGRP